MKYTLWMVLGIVIFFVGWVIKEQHSKDLGGGIMGVGLVLTAYLLIRIANKNLK